MALPSGVLTATVRFGPMIDDEGVPFSGRVSFTASRPRVWEATGTPIMPRPLTVALDEDGQGEIVLPATDQDGFTDGAGNAVKDWTYRVLIDLQGRSSDSRSFQLPTAGATGVVVDLDLLTPVPSSTGVVVALPSVLNVAGFTGAVTAEALSVAIAPELQPTLDSRYSQPIRPRVGFIGDSITAGYGTYPAQNVGNVEYADNPATHAMLASDGRWDLVVSAGVGGQRSDQIRARIPTDIIALGCNVCVIASCMWNDIGQALTVAQTIASFEGMINDCLAAGVVPVVALMTPDGINSATPDRVAAMQERNLRILHLATSRGVRVVDVQTPLVNPATGALKAEFNATDANAGSVHPNPAGYRAMGIAFQKVLDAMTPARAMGLVTFATDPTDMLGGKGLHLTEGATSGLGNLWFSSAPSAGVSFSRPAAQSGVGNAQRVTVAGTAADFNKGMQSALTTGWAVGDVLELTGILTTSGVQGRVQIQSGGTPTPYSNARVRTATTQTGGRFRVRYKVPAGTTNIGLTLTVSPGTGYVEVEQLSLRNLTARALD